MCLALPAAPRPRKKRPPPPSEFPFRLLNRVLWLLLLGATSLWILAWTRQDQLAAPDFYRQNQLKDPRQTPTSEPPFQVRAEGIDYLIEPVADYELDGVVVSFHDSDAFSDIYHHQDWKDFLNIRDLCVIWGANVANGVYRKLKFENSTWTCWVSAASQEAFSRLRGNQLSNNHLLAADSRIQAAIMTARPGDQIRVRGLLARYSHGNGAFQRGTSTSRDDTGNGACETLFVREFQRVAEANSGWRLLYQVAKWTALAGLLGILILLPIAPPGRLRD